MQEVTVTPTIEPTATPTATVTPTPTFTPVPTLNYYVEMVTPDGEPARLAREISMGEYLTILLLLAILVSMWSMFLSNKRAAAKRG